MPRSAVRTRAHTREVNEAGPPPGLDVCRGAPFRGPRAPRCLRATHTREELRRVGHPHPRARDSRCGPPLPGHPTPASAVRAAGPRAFEGASVPTTALTAAVAPPLSVGSITGSRASLVFGVLADVAHRACVRRISVACWVLAGGSRGGINPSDARRALRRSVCGG